MSQTISLTVNGAEATVDVADGPTLLSALRDQLGLKAARFGCGLEQCGACRVLIDGEAAFSCALPAEAAAGRAIVTLEGLGDAEHPHALQAAFIAEQAMQCGYCVSGVIMSAAGLLARNPRPTEADIREALDQNLCRCGAHNRMVRAVQRAAAELSGAADVG